MYVGRGRASVRRPGFEGTESAADKCVRIVDKRLKSMRAWAVLFFVDSLSSLVAYYYRSGGKRVKLVVGVIMRERANDD